MVSTINIIMMVYTPFMSNHVDSSMTQSKSLVEDKHTPGPHLRTMIRVYGIPVYPTINPINRNGVLLGF
jgi:hypothetical protein